MANATKKNFFRMLIRVMVATGIGSIYGMRTQVNESMSVNHFYLGRSDKARRWNTAITQRLETR